MGCERARSGGMVADARRKRKASAQARHHRTAAEAHGAGLHWGDGRGRLKFREALKERSERHSGFEAGEVRAEAEVQSPAEAQLGVRVAGEVDGARVFEDGRV